MILARILMDSGIGLPYGCTLAMLAHEGWRSAVIFLSVWVIGGVLIGVWFGQFVAAASRDLDCES